VLDVALAAERRIDEKLEQTIRLSGFSGRDVLQKHRDLFVNAQEACPQLPDVHCAQVVRFYFTAALAATEMTRGVLGGGRRDLEFDEPSGAGGKVIFYAKTTQLPSELRPPRSPRFVVPSLLRTQFSYELGGVVSSFEQSSDLSLLWPKAISGSYRRSQHEAALIEPFKAFTELKQWLKLSSHQLTSLLGIKRTTPNAWKREGRTPRPETEYRLRKLHAYVSGLANRPDAQDQLARIRPALPILTKAIYAEAAIPSETLEAAGVDIPFDWRKLNKFQAANEIPMAADEDGTPLIETPAVEGMVIGEDEDDLDLRY
jgi:hypothetical protein